MSFSSDVKEELCRQYGKDRHCLLAELAGICVMAGKVVHGKLLIDTDNALLADKYAVLMKKIFSVDVTAPMEREDADRVLAALHFDGACGESKSICGRVDGLLVQRECCKRAFIRGAFMAVGSVSDPNKSYHFEIVCKEQEQALQLQELMNSFEVEAKVVSRKKYYVVYLKEGAHIVDMLGLMGAYVSLMNLENVRIIKEMRNTVNRKVNCETANINKTVSAAVKQLEDVRRIQETIGFDGLPETLREMALLRLEYPDATLKELGTYTEPPVGKSGVNHRLRKLSEIAESIMGNGVTRV